MVVERVELVYGQERFLVEIGGRKGDAETASPETLSSAGPAGLRTASGRKQPTRCITAPQRTRAAGEPRNCPVCGKVFNSLALSGYQPYRRSTCSNRCGQLYRHGTWGSLPTYDDRSGPPTEQTLDRLMQAIAANTENAIQLGMRLRTRSPDPSRPESCTLCHKPIAPDTWSGQMKWSAELHCFYPENTHQDCRLAYGWEYYRRIRGPQYRAQQLAKWWARLEDF